MTVVFGNVINCVAGETPSPAFLQKISGKMNEGLPQMVDKEIQLWSTFAQVGAIGYYYVYVNYNANQIDGNYILSNRGQVENFVCSNPRMKSFVDDKVDVIYSYYGKDGKFITEIVVDVEKCLKH